MLDDALAQDQGACGLTADMTVRDWLLDPRGSAALAAALVTAKLPLDTLRPLSGFTIRAVAGMVGPAMQPVDAFVERARQYRVSEDWGSERHWASAALGRQPSNTMSE